MSLEALRAQLDDVDEELIATLARRAAVVEEIWAWKTANSVARVDPPREVEVRARLLAQAQALGLKRDAVNAILDRIIGVALR